MEQPKLRTRGGSLIPMFQPSVDNLLDQSHVFYGPSKTGKTVLVNYILDTLGSTIPMIWVLCPTEPQNESYKGRIPPQAIRIEVDDEIAIQFLETLWNRQEMASGIYKKATNLTTLRHLFDRVGAPSEFRRELHKIDQFETRIKQYFINAAATRGPEFRDYLEREKERYADIILRRRCTLYRAGIMPHRKRLMAGSDISEDERICLTYLTFNPFAAVVFDDCMASLKKFQKSSILAKVMTRGRHVHLTSCFVNHAITSMIPESRNNAFKSYFTTAAMATAFFENKNSGFSKDEIRQAKEAIQTIYDPSCIYRRLVFFRGAPDPFNWMIARKNPPRRLGSQYFWQYCENVGVNGTVLDKNNPFHSLFTAGLRV